MTRIEWVARIPALLATESEAGAGGTRIMSEILKCQVKAREPDGRSVKPLPIAASESFLSPSVDQARCPRTHGGRRRPGKPPRTAYALVSGMGLKQEGRAVKPSAQPTLVRTQHLPLL